MTTAALLNNNAAGEAVRAAANAALARSGAPGLAQRQQPRAAAGTTLAKVVIACARARGENSSAEYIASTMFGRDSGVMAIARSLTGSADTTTVGWAAELVRNETRAMLEELVPVSAWAALASLCLQVGFNGGNSVVVPSLNVGNGVGGGWIGEGGSIPIVRGSLASTRLRRFKLAGIVPITKELERASDPAAVEVVRKLLNGYVGNLLDQSMLDDAAEVPGVRPAGLLFDVAPIAGTAGGGVPALTADIKALTQAFLAAGLDPRAMALVVSLTQWAGLATMVDAFGNFAVDMGDGRVQTFPIIASAFVPAGTVIAVATSHFATAADPIEIDESNEAALVLADAAAAVPTHAGDAVGGGAVGTAREVLPDGGIPVSGGVGASVVGAVAESLFQTWSTAVRLVLPASFGVTKAGAVQVVNGVTW